jgi:membrane protein implicated in regulation of membrane protease activity
VSRSFLVTLGCCLVAAILAVIDQANDTTLWTALFATAVLLVTTALVGRAALRMLGRSDEEDDSDEDPR